MKKLPMLLIISLLVFSCEQENATFQVDTKELTTIASHDLHDHGHTHSHYHDEQGNTHYYDEEPSSMYSFAPSYATIYRCNYPDFLIGKTVYIDGVGNWGSSVKSQILLVINDLNSYTNTINFITSDPQGTADYTISLEVITGGNGCSGTATGYKDEFGFPQTLNGNVPVMGTIVRTGSGIINQGRRWIRSMFAHELGHCIGLKHPDELGCAIQGTSAPSPVMLGASCGDPFYHLYNSGEIQTLQTIYTAPVTQ